MKKKSENSRKSGKLFYLLVLPANLVWLDLFRGGVKKKCVGGGEAGRGKKIRWHNKLSGKREDEKRESAESAMMEPRGEGRGDWKTGLEEIKTKFFTVDKAVSLPRNTKTFPTLLERPANIGLHISLQLFITCPRLPRPGSWRWITWSLKIMISPGPGFLGMSELY